MGKRQPLLWLAGTCFAAIATQATAQGQTAGNDQATPAPASAGQNEIIITAEKRPQLLIDVPQSVSVVSGQALEQQHATNFQDYLKLVPGLQLDQSTPGEGRLIIRGINTGGVASIVSVYMDETPFGSSSGLVNGGVLAADFDTFDLNRIEVLRGPQGTLYGASSLGGVLRFVTNAPQLDRVVARGRVGLESTKGGDLGYSTNLLVNVPLSSTVAFRASGAFRKDAGFIDSIGTVGLNGPTDVAKNINDDKVYGGRASLLFKPSNIASLRLTAVAQNIDANAPTLIEADPVTLRPLHGISQSQYQPQYSNLHYRLFNATGTYNLGFGTLTSSTSLSKQNQRRLSDYTNLYSWLLSAAFGFPPNEFVQPQDTNLKKFTQEVRIAGESPAFDWLVGGYYTHEKGLIGQDLVALQPGTNTPLDVTPILGTKIIGNLALGSKYRELAGFANATVHLSPQFDLQFGGRYSGNKQSAHQSSEGPLAGGTTDFTNRSSEHVFTYSVAPKFKLNADSTIYARVAKGFRPGGPNVVAPTAPASLRTYGSDSVVSYEVGAKTQTSDRRFSLDAAAFHINWKDIQLFTVIVDPATSIPYGVNINGSRARSDGVELTATARPVPGLDLALNAAYTHARLTDDTPPDVAGRDGDELPFSPKLSIGLNGDYHWQVRGHRAHVGASLRHVSRQTAEYDADFVATYDRQRRIRAYNVVDLNAGIDFGRIALDAYVKNLGNSHGVTSTTGPSSGGLDLYPGGAIGTGIIRPRTIGATLSFNY